MLRAWALTWAPSTDESSLCLHCNSSNRLSTLISRRRRWMCCEEFSRKLWSQVMMSAGSMATKGRGKQVNTLSWNGVFSSSAEGVKMDEVLGGQAQIYPESWGKGFYRDIPVMNVCSKFFHILKIVCLWVLNLIWSITEGKFFDGGWSRPWYLSTVECI